MRTTISMLSVAAFVLTGALTANFGSAWAQTSCDFMTGGGYIVFDNGTHGNFGVGGGCKNGSPTWGHLEYVDHGSALAPTTAPTPFNVHGTGVTGYFFITPTTRDVSGKARTNDQKHANVNYCVEVSDNDPSGTDTFVIQLTDQGSTVPFYTTQLDVDSTVHGGTIEIHKHNPSNTGSFSSGTTCLVTGVSCGPTTCDGNTVDTCTDTNNCGACGNFCGGLGCCAGSCCPG